MYCQSNVKSMFVAKTRCKILINWSLYKPFLGGFLMNMATVMLKVSYLAILQSYKMIAGGLQMVLSFPMDRWKFFVEIISTDVS